MTALLLALSLGCQGLGKHAEVDTTPTALGHTECDVCGMTVATQPAPRAQLVYRDGSHPHFCSLGELRAALAAPSPHGKPIMAYVEALPADFDPASTDTAPQPWVDAEQAWYIFGISRPQVMGLPALSFASEPDARAAADRLGQQAVPWSAVRDTPFNLSP